MTFTGKNETSTSVSKKEAFPLMADQPEDIKNIGLGAIWSFGKATGLP
jgi:hypothetical protein